METNRFKLSMKFFVSFPRNNNKILRSIVRLNTVKMVDNLTPPHQPTNFLLRNQEMFRNVGIGFSALRRTNHFITESVGKEPSPP